MRLVRFGYLFGILCLCFVYADSTYIQGNKMIITMEIINETKQKEKTLYIELEENVASKEFIKQLPLELEFSDYANKEKVAHLPCNLSVKNTPNYNPQIGDFFYFSPWGNIGIFYGKQPPFNGLVYLGKILQSNLGENEIETLREIKQDFKAIIKAK